MNRERRIESETASVRLDADKSSSDGRRLRPNPEMVAAIQFGSRATADGWHSLRKTMRPIILTILLALSCSLVVSSAAQDLRIPLPKKSKYTPVQKLNRDGVDALKKHRIDHAKKYFYKAYLIDPNDPFTLNNLGYVAELEGEIERAQRFYDLAQANTSEALVDKSTEPPTQGRKVSEIAGRTEEGPMKVNELNREAIRLLSKDRAPEADMVLQQALKLDPKNPFTLNNLGFAREKEGELEQAAQFYSQSAMTGARDEVVVALDNDWRGKPISDIAARNVDKVRREMEKSEDIDTRVARLNLRGVSAMNRNERKAARDYFEQAYKLDPSNSFTINNMGYLAELEGDRETAQLFYERAQKANHASAKVLVATRPEAEGHSLAAVAEQSDTLVDARVQADAAVRRQAGGKPALRTRDDKVIVDKPAPPK